MYGGIKYSYSADTIAKAIKNRNGSLYQWLLSHESWRTGIHRPKRPTTGEKLQAATTKAQKKKVISDALKYTKNFSYLLGKTMDAEPSLIQADGIMDAFVPSNMPLEPSPDDPILKQCFVCESQTNLGKCHDVKICTECNRTTMTRDQVMDHFYLSKTEADKISRKKRTGGYRQIVYAYNVKTVATHAKKKWGSLYTMIKKH
jgi:hypothetical protein